MTFRQHAKPHLTLFYVKFLLKFNNNFAVCDFFTLLLFPRFLSLLAGQVEVKFEYGVFKVSFTLFNTLSHDKGSFAIVPNVRFVSPELEKLVCLVDEHLKTKIGRKMKLFNLVPRGELLEIKIPEQGVPFHRMDHSY